MSQMTQMPTYASKIIKAGALLPDTKILLSNWNEEQSVTENLARFRQENTFGKTSRSRVEDILAIFRQRYLSDETIIQALVTLIDKEIDSASLNRILYFHAARSDELLHDVVTDFLYPVSQTGLVDMLTTNDIKTWIERQIQQGNVAKKWSETTIIRCARELLASLRDFGILEGNTRKRLASQYFPIKSFAYIAFFLKQSQPSGSRLIHDPEWRLFLIDPGLVERLFIEAQQHKLLEYYAAGSIVKIEFPADNLVDYAQFISQRAY
jgi:hypothetical protein